MALYEAPALTATKLFVVSRYYPVEVISRQKEWARVRDASGAIALDSCGGAVPPALVAGDGGSGFGQGRPGGGWPHAVLRRA
ncbi:SH3 domain-containing protein [Paludibacterium denitrificans]|uniref:SH3 domain-containing protein n=1 Tax=Paludibacterium denitrificans TaxID=2675226 RepID=UPI001E2EFC67|nr:SH3 domain-containing protein [Paludibacterium denitrificans]